MYVVTGLFYANDILNETTLVCGVIFDMLMIITVVVSSFKKNRLAKPIIIYIFSTVYMVCSFSAIYHIIGILDSDGNYIYDYSSTVYFSAITWTALGYGDIVPSIESRWYIVMEVFFGYIHMSLLIGLIMEKLSVAK